MLISLALVVAILVVVVWRLVVPREPSLLFGGFRHSLVDKVWYADLWITNTTAKTIHCKGYVTRDRGGLHTNDSMLDFQCTVDFEGKRVQVWPLWLATWLDLKPGEAAKLGLNIVPEHVPSQIALIYDPLSPNQTGQGNPFSVTPASTGLASWQQTFRNLLSRPWNYLRSKFGFKDDAERQVWCPTKLSFPKHLPVETNSSSGLTR